MGLGTWHKSKNKEINSEYCSIKQYLKCNHTFPIDLAPKRNQRFFFRSFFASYNFFFIREASTSRHQDPPYLTHLSRSHLLNPFMFKGGTRGSPIMPRDKVSRTANVERNGGHKWVNAEWSPSPKTPTITVRN